MMESITGEPKAWRGAMIGALVGLLYAAVNLGISAFQLMNDPGEGFLTRPPESIIYRVVGALGALIAGILAGGFGGWIAFKMADPADGSWKRVIKNLCGSSVGGAIGALIGTAFIWIAYFGWETTSSGSRDMIPQLFLDLGLFGILSIIVGSVIGLISGLLIGTLGETIGGVLPLALASVIASLMFAVPGLPILTRVWYVIISEIIWLGIAILRMGRPNLLGQEWSESARRGALGAVFGSIVGAAFSHFGLAAILF